MRGCYGTGVRGLDRARESPRYRVTGGGERGERERKKTT